MSKLDEQKPSRWLWVLAAVAALALHVGGAALAISHLQAEEADDEMGAMAIEVGIEMASVRREVTDLPPGPDADASAASPQLSEQKAEVRDTDLQQDKPTEENEADRIVTPNESKKPKDDDPKVQAVQTAASTESVAAEATATPSSDAIPEGERSVACHRAGAHGGSVQPGGVLESAARRGRSRNGVLVLSLRCLWLAATWTASFQDQMRRPRPF